MKTIKNSSGIRVILPDDVPDSEADKGIPIGVHLAALNIDLPEAFLNQLQIEIEKRGMYKKEDYHKPGAYKVVTDALRQMLKVTANSIVDTVREEA